MRIAVVSPFLDRQHGTERCVVEQVERLAEHGAEMHLYCERAEQIRGLRISNGNPKCQPGEIVLHRIPGIPGPHLLKFIWWYFANQKRRRWDKRKEKVELDLVYSPGINCPDADVIVVHIVFRAFYESIRQELQWRRVPWRQWPLILHRRIYYRLIMAMEKRIFRNRRIGLIAVAPMVAGQLLEHFKRGDVAVIPNAVDTKEFTLPAREAKRAAARAQFGFSEKEFVLLLIGNDWKKKGLDALLGALALLKDIRPQLLVVGADDPQLYRSRISKLNLEADVRLTKPSADVLFFYAAADAYVGPSIEDAFGLPVLEAMACGLPAVASSKSGVSDYVTDGVTGFLLKNPQDPAEIAATIRRLQGDAELRDKVGQAAAHYAQENCSWAQNVARTLEFFNGWLARKQMTGNPGESRAVVHGKRFEE